MALTNAEKFEHMGRLIYHVIGRVPDQKAGRFLEKLFPHAKNYVVNGTNGTQAERLEAMEALRDAVFELQTGKDATIDEHFKNAHWLPDVEVEE